MLVFEVELLAWRPMLASGDEIESWASDVHEGKKAKKSGRMAEVILYSFDLRLGGGHRRIERCDCLNTSRLSKPRERKPLGIDDKVQHCRTIDFSNHVLIMC